MGVEPYPTVRQVGLKIDERSNKREDRAARPSLRHVGSDISDREIQAPTIRAGEEFGKSVRGEISAASHTARITLWHCESRP